MISNYSEKDSNVKTLKRKLSRKNITFELKIGVGVKLELVRTLDNILLMIGDDDITKSNNGITFCLDEVMIMLPIVTW